MKITWKGSMNEHNLFVCPDLPGDTKKLVSDQSAWTMYLLMIPILILAYVGIKLRLAYVAGTMFTKWALLAGAALSLPFLVAHEFIHTICCPKTSEIFLYVTSAGICIIPTCPLSKRRYIIMALMPTVILGICPFLVWLFDPVCSVQAGSILFGFSLGSLSMCIGDIYNAILAGAKMTSDSVLVTSGKDCYYFKRPTARLR